MATLEELARHRTGLGAPEVAHLHRLIASWGLLADLCFADLLLYVPTVAAHRGGAPVASPDRLVVVGHVRPTTSATLFAEDLVGEEVSAEDRPVARAALDQGEIVAGASTRPGLAEQVDVRAIPVRAHGRIIAVLGQESAPSVSRRRGELENAYLGAFERLARMVAAGDFPFAEGGPVRDLPRVADGVLLLDGVGTIDYTSPNGMSALHRLGVRGPVGGRRLHELGLDEAVVRHAFAARAPATMELSGQEGAHVLAHCIPLLERSVPVGGVLLVRDVSDLRRLDRLLVTKDAHIREIHHRVKNNLQTISSLLRIQARRLQGTEARQAVEDSVRRIGSIALVHEILSREAADDVPFGEIARPIVRMVEESLLEPERSVRFELAGELPVLPSAVATPLALVLTELLQNVVDHAFPRSGDGELGAGGEVLIHFADAGPNVVVTVTDEGRGLPPGFDLESDSGLGLSIVRALVEGELAGRIALRPRADGRAGTEVVLEVPVVGPVS